MQQWCSSSVTPVLPYSWSCPRQGATIYCTAPTGHDQLETLNSEQQNKNIRV